MSYFIELIRVMIIVIGIACGYHLLQLVRLLTAMAWLGKISCHCSKLMAWVSLILDQVNFFITFFRKVYIGST